MKCQKCGAELEEGALFCKDCGAKVEFQKIRFCRDCGAEIVEGSRFCSKCGADLRAIDSIDAMNSIKENKPDNSHETNPYSNSVSQTVSHEIGDFTNKIPDVANSIGKSKVNKESKSENLTTVLVAILIIAIICIALIPRLLNKEGKEKNKETSNFSIPTISTEYGDIYVEYGSQYAYMSDEWNVYIANAISDNVIKIERWKKALKTSKTLKYDSDIGTYKINDPINGFSWIDKEHTAFVFTFEDKNNSHVKATAHIFTINISDSDESKGTDYDERIACYSYVCDDWHMYRAIPLTDSIIKIECWSRGMAFGQYSFGWDWMVFDWTNTDSDFSWTDEKHSGFTITTRDPQNKSYWKDDTFVAFMLENPDYLYDSVYSYIVATGTHSEDESQIPVSNMTEDLTPTIQVSQNITSEPTSTPTSEPTSTPTPEPKSTPTPIPIPTPTEVPVSSNFVALERVLNEYTLYYLLDLDENTVLYFAVYDDSDEIYADKGKLSGSKEKGFSLKFDQNYGSWQEKLSISGQKATIIDSSGFKWDYKIADVEKVRKYTQKGSFHISE